jgi:hypothetical protein
MNLDKLYSLLASWSELRESREHLEKVVSGADEEGQIRSDGIVSEQRPQTGGETERERAHRLAA